MIRTLVRKELHTLGPFLALVCIFFLMTAAGVLFTAFPDQLELPGAFEMLGKDGWKGVALANALLTLSLASGLLVGEHDQGTLEFLDSLPVGRTRVFLVKAALAWAVLCVGPSLGVLAGLGLRAFSLTSLDSSFYLEVLAKNLLLHYCQLFVLLGAGLLLSFLRRLMWMMTAVIFLCYGLLFDIDPGISRLNFVTLTRPVFRGQALVFPWDSLVLQLGFGAACYFLAWVLFTGAGERLLRKTARVGNRRLGRLLWSGVGALSLVLWLVVIVRSSNQGDESSTDKKHFSDAPVAHTSTVHYLFSYPGDQQARLAPLIDQADEVHDRVCNLLDVKPGDRIQVEVVSSGIGAHLAGLAFWKKIRIDLSAHEASALPATLAHETTHVYLDLLSERRLGEMFQWSRFFHEGTATYVEFQTYGAPGRRELSRTIAAISYAWYHFPFEDLVDNAYLEETYDTDLVYPLGELFVAALCSQYGEKAPAVIARTFARDDAPQDLEGMALWRDAFQAAGYDLDTTIAHFYGLLNQEKERRTKLIESLPRLHGSFVDDTTSLISSADIRTAVGAPTISAEGESTIAPGDEPGTSKVSGPAFIPEAGPGIRLEEVTSSTDWTPTCRFRPVGVTSKVYFRYSELEDGVFPVPEELAERTELWYQLGLRDPEGKRTVWTKWTRLLHDR